MVGNCDSEFGFLLPMMIGPKNDADKETILKMLAEMIGKPTGMAAEQATKIANDSLTAMEKIYGSDPKCPFKQGDSQFSRYCYTKAFADQVRNLNHFRMLLCPNYVETRALESKLIPISN